MSVNIYDAANQLERDLRKTDQYKKLEEAFETLQKDDEAKALFDQFRLTQQTLQQKQMTGQEIGEDEAKQAQELSQKVGNNDVLSELIQAEQELGQMIEEINQIALKPIQELYQANQPKQPDLSVVPDEAENSEDN
ncbi:hypothetical protein B8A44_05905 [Dolosigranulum pigrum]|jgi:UPF0342 protein SSP0954|uniref:UPF0342 protein HMPREF9703_00954 n=2 Tax=Dolosigranulum pigrum TaxID=29394 RepID=H3NEH3_9LACT|nr:YlbF family regulator [Dolosigranulum pigrum]EHR32838.1 hypothetical protein HMPREF9703_00954 [Dolosigranulum pigrum ATCC 51524]OOL80962.1 hypothetical protein BWX42_03570 [Dolosigranulum pigrum]QDO91518.1 YlbF family regulator [Dolosigranulum pigrum]QJS96386.1 YlbF family regulator [Dolosigranulum pigrum]QJS98373.1 YlbF family regulator [Dolosigranulum pigrum]